MESGRAFSADDLASHERGYPALLDITKGGPVGALVFAKKAVAGDIWTSQGRIALSHATVIGAQMTISCINTFLTAIFVSVVQLPNASVVIGLTFLCGLIPIVGNIVSNTVIVFIGFMVSPRVAIGALIFLVVVHKLEYFLNSKIIGDRIRNPIWLTLFGLIVGEKIMGIPGMILSPVVLNYLRIEMSKIEVTPAIIPADRNLVSTATNETP